MTQKNELANKVQYELSNGTNIELTNQAIRNITNNNTKITDSEIGMFIKLCEYQKLNPFTKEAYLVKYDNSKPAQQIVSVSAFQRIAEDNKNYDGMEDGIIIKTTDEKIEERQGCVLYPKEILLGGWCKVYRKDRSRPTISKTSLKEFSKGQATWTAMPCVMINKCAKVNALRNAFPNSFGGCYVEEEIEQQKETKQEPMQSINADDVFLDDATAEIIDVEEETLEELPNIDEVEFVEDKLVCSKCGEKISEKVANFSKDRFGKQLCFDCQKTQ